MAKAKTFAEIMAEATDDQLFGVSTFEDVDAPEPDEDSSATTLEFALQQACDRYEESTR